MEPMKPVRPDEPGDGTVTRASAFADGGSGTIPPRDLPGPDAIRATVETDPPVVVDVEPTAPDTPHPELGADVAAADPDPDPGGVHEESRARPGLVLPVPPSRGQSPGVGRVEVVIDGWRFEVTLEPARRAALRERARRTAGASVSGPRVVRAPLPGRIARVFVAAGDEVEAGARLCSLEAMKMENEILAPAAGTIERVGVEPGVRVEQGDELVVIG